MRTLSAILCFAVTIGTLFSMLSILQGCDPGYSVWVRANLAEPLEQQCIDDAMHKLDGLEGVAISKSEPYKVWTQFQGTRTVQARTQYVFYSQDGRGILEQREDEKGQTVLGAGTAGVGAKPPQENLERIQAFSARMVSQVAQACKAKYSDRDGFKCHPDSTPCREALLDQASK